MKKVKIVTNENEKQKPKKYCNLKTNYTQYELTQNFQKVITELQMKNQLSGSNDFNGKYRKQ